MFRKIQLWNGSVKAIFLPRNERNMSPKRPMVAVLQMLNLTPPWASRAIFYIYTPDYTYMHSGIRCLHLLCHHLNRLGYRSYVNTQVTNPNLNTPFADAAMLDQFRQDGLANIVIYPEVVAGNPLNAKYVVRYLLNRPGFFTGAGIETYGAADFFSTSPTNFSPMV